MSVANTRGTQIGLGELAEGLRILSEGVETDDVGVSSVEFDDIGDAAGPSPEVAVEGFSFQMRNVW